MPSRMSAAESPRERELVVAVQPARPAVWVQGGQIGCDGYWAGVGDIAVGSRSAFFLVPNAPRLNGPDVQEAWQVWSISGDQVSTEFEGKVPLPTLIERASVH